MTDDTANKTDQNLFGESAPDARSADAKASKPKPKRKRRSKSASEPIELAQNDLQTKLKDTVDKLKQRDRDVKKLEQQCEKLAASKVKAEQCVVERAVEQESAEQGVNEAIMHQRAEIEQQHRETVDQLRQDLRSTSDREREMAERISHMVAERDQATDALTEARKQLEEHRHAFEAVRARMTADQRDRVELQQQLDELREALSGSGVRVDDAMKDESSVVTEIVSQPSWSMSQVIGFVAVAVLIAVSIGLGLFTWMQLPHRGQQVVGWLYVSGNDESTLNECRSEAQEAPQEISVAGLMVDVMAEQSMVQLAIDPEQALLDAETAKQHIDQLGEYVASQSSNGDASQTHLAIAGELDDTMTRIRESLKALRSVLSSDQAGESAKALQAVEQFVKTYQERQQLAADLASVETQLTTLLAPSRVVAMDEIRLAEAERSDNVLQADMAELVRRQSLLRATLLQSLDGADEDFRTLGREVAAGCDYLDTTKAGQHGDDVNQHLDTLKGALSQWKAAADLLKITWDTERELLAGTDEAVDPLASRDQLEQAVRAFTTAIHSSMEQYHKALNQIDQGGDLPSTRVVLKRNIELRLGNAVRSCDPLIATARSIMLENDPGLSALVPSIVGLRSRVEQRRDRIAETQQQQMLRDKEEQRATLLDKAEEQSTVLRDELAKLDQQLMQTSIDVDSLRSAMPGSGTVGQTQLDMLSKELAGLISISEALRLEASDPSGVTVLYVPARMVATVEDSSGRLQQAMIVSAIPMSGALLVLAAMYALRVYQRGEESMQQVADALEEASRSDAMDG